MILKKKKIKGVLKYLIKWQGFDGTTWEPAKSIKEDVPKMVNAFEKSLK